MLQLPSYVATANMRLSFLPVANTKRKQRFLTLAFASFLLSFAALHSSAQCNVFQDADAANPVLSALQPGETITSLDFVDIDGDGDLDCYTVPPLGAPQLLRNVGTPRHAVYERSPASGFEGATTPDGAPIIQFVDIDGDGDYDCFITQVSFEFRPVTSILFYRNTGSATTPQFTEDEDNNPAGFARSNNNYVLFTFADIDNDGDEDLYYTGFYNTTYNDYDQFTYINNGTSHAASYTLYSNDHPHDFQRQRTYYDWNKDGLPDYFAYDNLQNQYSYYRNIGPLQQPHYVKETAGGPLFAHGLPYRLVDLNSDAAPESFTAPGNYATVAPVAVIKQDSVSHRGINVTRLNSEIKDTSYRYRWEYSGRQLPASSQSFIYAALPGKYVLYITNECGTGVSLAYTLTGRQWKPVNTDNRMDNLTATSLSADVKAVAYPNPFTHYVTLQLPQTKAATESRIVVTDMAGKILIKQTTMAAQTQVGQGLQRGMYLLQVWQNGTVIYHTKLMKE